MLPLRPAGPRMFQSRDPLGLVAWLQSLGFTIVIDEPAQVRLEQGEETITILADGQVQAGGELVERAYRRLLSICEEQ